MKLVSLLRTWNCEHLITRSLAHAMSMSDAIIMLDSGSNDNTLDIAKQFLNKRFDQGITEPPVILIPHEVNADQTNISRDSELMFTLVGELSERSGWGPSGENAESVWVCYLMPDEFISNVTVIRPWLEGISRSPTELRVIHCRRYEFWYSEEYYRGDRQYADEQRLEVPEIFIRYVPGMTSYESDRVPHHIPSRAPIGLRKESFVIAGMQGFADPRMFVKHYQFWDHQKCLQKAHRMTELGDSNQAQIDHVSQNPYDESIIKSLRKWPFQDILWNEEFTQVLKELPGHPPQPMVSP